MADLTKDFTATIARHFAAATVAGSTVELGVGGLSIRCTIGACRPWGALATVQLLFEIAGGGLPAGVELSMTGYAASEREAVITAGCAWACSFGPVLRAGFAGEVQPAIGRFAVARAVCFTDNFDQVLHFSPDGGEEPGAARVRLGAAPYLAPRVLAQGLPLPAGRPAVLSVFVGEMPGTSIVEVKLDGREVPGFADLLTAIAPPQFKQSVLLREVAVIVPAAG